MYSQSRWAFWGVVFSEIVTNKLCHILCDGIIDVRIEIVCHIFYWIYWICVPILYLWKVNFFLISCISFRLIMPRSYPEVAKWSRSVANKATNDRSTPIMILQAHIPVEKIVIHSDTSPAHLPIVQQVLRIHVWTQYKYCICGKVCHILLECVIFEQQEWIGIRNIDR